MEDVIMEVSEKHDDEVKEKAFRIYGQDTDEAFAYINGFNAGEMRMHLIDCKNMFHRPDSDELDANELEHQLYGRAFGIKEATNKACDFIGNMMYSLGVPADNEEKEMWLQKFVKYMNDEENGEGIHNS